MVCALCVNKSTHNTTGNGMPKWKRKIRGYNAKVKKGPNTYNLILLPIHVSKVCSVAAAVIEHKKKIIPTFPKATVVGSNTHFHFK